MKGPSFPETIILRNDDGYDLKQYGKSLRACAPHTGGPDGVEHSVSYEMQVGARAAMSPERAVFPRHWMDVTSRSDRAGLSATASHQWNVVG